MTLGAWWRNRRAKKLEKPADEAEGAREGREVWESKRLGRQWGAMGGGRRTSYDEGKAGDWPD